MAAKQQTKKPLAPMVAYEADREAKREALRTAMKQIERDFGEGAIMKAGREPAHGGAGGAYRLAVAGRGTGHRRRAARTYYRDIRRNPPVSTTVALHIVAEVQKAGGDAAFIDAEHALDPVYAKALGVDTDNLLVSLSRTAARTRWSICESLVRSGAIDVVVVDSVAAPVPRQEIEGSMGAATVAVQARLMSQAMRKLSAVISKSQTVVIFINQLREKVGVLYGNPEKPRPAVAR